MAEWRDSEAVADMDLRAAGQVRLLLYASTGLGAAATVAVALRFLARYRKRVSLGADDLAIGLGLLPLWGLVIVACIRQ
jgi:hypothetical protein